MEKKNYLALSAHVSSRIIHFRVLDKSPVLGPGRGPPSCNSFKRQTYRKPTVDSEDKWELLQFSQQCSEAAGGCLVTQSCLTLRDPMDCSTPDFSVHHDLLQFVQTYVHGVNDAIQPSHHLSSPSLPALHLSQHQGLFQWVGSLHQVLKVLQLQLQHQSFHWVFRVDFL